jgi:hypothetical protein
MLGLWTEAAIYENKVSSGIEMSLISELVSMEISDSE